MSPVARKDGWKGWPHPGLWGRPLPVLIALVLLSLGGPAVIQAHESFMDCFDNDDDTITCIAGYDDGAPPLDSDRILIKDGTGKTLISGAFDQDGGFTFERPPGDDFMAIFMGSEIGHTHRVNARDVIR